MSNYTSNDENNKDTSRRSNVAFGIIGTSFIGTIILISPFITMQLRSPLPYMATPRRKVIAALEDIAKRKKKSMSLKNASTNNNHSHIHDKKLLRYYDLGSGDGETVLAASSAGWKATGIELNSTLWALSSLRRLFSPSNIRRKSDFKWGNMWAHSIHDADAVMIFGVKPLMPKIAQKVRNECLPGTYVMSYRFLIPCIGVDESTSTSTSNVTSTKVDDSIEINTKIDDNDSSLDADLIYDKDEMRIYELRSPKN